jgi:hypothetical protein
MGKRNEPSELYLRCLEESKQHHASSKTYSGKFLRPHAPAVKQLIEEYRIRSILDYGCGKGEQYRWVSHGGADQSIPEGQTLETYWGLPVQKFDPAYPPLSKRPSGEFDLVLCTHVLGSIPIIDLDWVLDELGAYASKVIYIAEKIGPVKKQVFSAPDQLPRWTREQWLDLFYRFKVRHRATAARIWFATREKTETGAVITEAGWI